MATTRVPDREAEGAGSPRPIGVRPAGRRSVGRNGVGRGSVGGRRWMKIAAVTILGPAAITAMAAPAVAAPRTGERQCVFTYVVTDGGANNVRTYRSARGTTRSAAIRPNESFLVFFGTGDHGLDNFITL